MAPKQKKQYSEALNKRKLEKKYETLQRYAFIALAEFRDRTSSAFSDLEVPDEILPDIHKLSMVEYYLEILATGTEEEKLNLLREGVISKWAKLYSPKMICQLSRTLS